jgi:hypothetical protein
VRLTPTIATLIDCVTQDGMVTGDDPESAAFCAELTVDVSPAQPAQGFEDPAEHRRRLLAERQAVAAVKALPPLDEDDTSPEPY